MPTPITFTLTDAGLSAALDANANGLTISLTQIAIGSGKYTPLASRTALQTELARYPLSGGDVEPNSKTLRFSAVIESAATRQAFEVGLFTSTGVLFAVASTTDTDPLILVTANIAFVAAFGMVVSEIPAGSLTVVTDPNAPLAIALINQHLAVANPHPQYGMKAAFDSHVVKNATEHTNLTNLISAETTARTNADTAHTAAANPHPQYGMKAAFDTHVVQNTTEHTDLTNLISAETTARTNADTAHTAAANPHPQYGMKAAFDSHVIQNGVEHANLLAMIQAVNQRVANLEIREEIQIGEFIITDDPRNPVTYKGYGDWRLVPNVLLKGLNSGGTVGQLSQVAAGSDQSVRTTFFWQRFDPNEVAPLRTISISADSTDVNLLVLFTATYGAPVIGERAHFIIESGVLVTASTTSNYAIVTGNWPPDSNLTMDVLGIASGRGGNGNLGSSTDALNGRNGGGAIAATHPLLVNNFNIVAGGGAGGAGVKVQSGGGLYSVIEGGGGAPYGEKGNGFDSFSYTAGQDGGRLIGGDGAVNPRWTVTGGGFATGGKGGDIGAAGQAANSPPYDGGNGGLAGIAITGPVTVTGNPVLGR